ncbi:hypothetical protein Tco_0683567 [Tanacetum coccineum]
MSSTCKRSIEYRPPTMFNDPVTCISLRYPIFENLNPPQVLMDVILKTRQPVICIRSIEDGYGGYQDGDSVNSVVNK